MRAPGGLYPDPSLVLRAGTYQAINLREMPEKSVKSAPDPVQARLSRGTKYRFDGLSWVWRGFALGYLCAARETDEGERGCRQRDTGARACGYG